MTGVKAKMGSIAVLSAIYAATTVPMFALWEIAQLPLYTIWDEQGVQASLVAALHCTLGDGVIAFIACLASFGLATVVPAFRESRRFRELILGIGVVTTAVTEWVSTQWLGRWAYLDIMPIDPFFGIGLSPLGQWLVIPAAGLCLLHHRFARTLQFCWTGAPAAR